MFSPKHSYGSHKKRKEKKRGVNKTTQKRILFYRFNISSIKCRAKNFKRSLHLVQP